MVYTQLYIYRKDYSKWQIFPSCSMLPSFLLFFYLESQTTVKLGQTSSLSWMDLMNSIQQRSNQLFQTKPVKTDWLTSFSRTRKLYFVFNWYKTSVTNFIRLTDKAFVFISWSKILYQEVASVCRHQRDNERINDLKGITKYCIG